MAGGGSETTTSEQVSKLDLPKWVEQAGRANYEKAIDVAKKMGKMGVYTGPEVANQSNMTTDAYKYMMENVGKTDPLYNNAAALQGRITELDPIYSKAQGILSDVAGAGWDPQKYLNPFTEEVEKNAVSNARRTLDLEQMQLADSTRKSGAFGGSAGAIQQGVLAAEGARGIGDLSAELRRAGYDKATADMMAHQTLRKDTANSMISGASTQGQGWLDTARGFLDTAGGFQQTAGENFARMMAGGASEEAQRQKELDAARAKFYEKRNLPLEKLNLRLAALGMTPYGQTQTTTGSQTTPTQGPDWASIIFGGIKTGAGVAGLSDRRDKKDIQKLGKDKKTGIPIYAYRYKDAKASTPKVVGPMAQDIEKVWPDAVREIGGHKVVRGDILGMLSA